MLRVSLGFLVLISVLFTSCKGKQKETAALSSKTCSQNFSSVKEYLLSIQAKNRLNNAFYRINGEIELANADENIQLSVQIRIKKDSLMWMSFKKIGLPIAKVLITQDSIFVLNNFQKNQLTTSIQAMEKLLGINLTFEQLQAVILSKIPTQLNYQAMNTETNGYLLQVNSSHELLIDCLNDIPLQIKFQQLAKNQQFVFNYKDLHQSEGIQYHQKIQFQQFQLGTDSTDLNSLKNQGVLHIKTLEIKDELVFPFSIPSNYEKMD